MMAWFSVNIVSVLFLPSVRIIASDHMDQHQPALRLWIRLSKSCVTYCIAPLINRPTYCIITECNHV